MTLEDTKRILVGEWVSVTPEVRPSATRNPDGTLKPFYLSRERGHADDRGLCGSPQLGGVGRVRAVAGRATSERFREDVRAVRPGRGPQLHGVRPDLCSGGLSVLGGKGMTIFRADLLKGKRILVTGGGTGLGREVAGEYAKLGAEVYICGRRGGVVAETARELAETHNTRVTPIECDIRSPDAVENMMTRVFNEGPLSGLVNNAAGNFISRTKDLSPNGFNAIANIVFHGTFYVTLAAGTRWIEARQQANVVSILTTSVWNGGPFTVPSAMSKAGIDVMTKSLAVEWAPYGIRLNAIAPGLFPTKGAGERLNPGSIRSGTIDKAQDASGTIPMGRVGQMQELRNLATFLMADGCDYLTGETIVIDGGAFLGGGGGTFWQLSHLGDQDWENIRNTIKGANEKDKAKRTA